ncbi:hypothetical protein K2W90_04775 [Candidatus Babeliales bacterium]|nr:hypothetical protein [Candidatus Babeliales bacterium]
MKRNFFVFCAFLLSVGSAFAAAAQPNNLSQTPDLSTLFARVVDLIKDESNEATDEANKILCVHRELVTMGDDNGWLLFDYANEAGNWRVAECLMNFEDVGKSHEQDAREKDNILEV